MSEVRSKSNIEIEITLGYPKADDMSRRLEFKWSGYSIRPSLMSILVMSLSKCLQ